MRDIQKTMMQISAYGGRRIDVGQRQNEVAAAQPEIVLVEEPGDEVFHAAGVEDGVEAGAGGATVYGEGSHAEGSPFRMMAGSAQTWICKF